MFAVWLWFWILAGKAPICRKKWRKTLKKLGNLWPIDINIIVHDDYQFPSYRNNHTNIIMTSLSHILMMWDQILFVVVVLMILSRRRVEEVEVEVEVEVCQYFISVGGFEYSKYLATFLRDVYLPLILCFTGGSMWFVLFVCFIFCWFRDIEALQSLGKFFHYESTKANISPFWRLLSLNRIIVCLSGKCNLQKRNGENKKNKKEKEQTKWKME